MYIIFLYLLRGNCYFFIHNLLNIIFYLGLHERGRTNNRRFIFIIWFENSMLMGLLSKGMFWFLLKVSLSIIFISWLMDGSFTTPRWYLLASSKSLKSFFPLKQCQKKNRKRVVVGTLLMNENEYWMDKKLNIFYSFN